MTTESVEKMTEILNTIADCIKNDKPMIYVLRTTSYSQSHSLQNIGLAISDVMNLHPFVTIDDDLTKRIMIIFKLEPPIGICLSQTDPEGMAEEIATVLTDLYEVIIGE